MFASDIETCKLVSASEAPLSLCKHMTLRLGNKNEFAHSCCSRLACHSGLSAGITFFEIY